MSYSSYLGLILPKNNGGNYGSPLVANLATDMTDQTRVYVYTGSETGYTAGNWYYWNGSAWTSGGVYNSTALQTDTTLAIPGMAADAKSTGDAIGNLDTRLDTAEDDITDVKSDLQNKVSVIISSASGSIAHFEDGSESDAVDVVAHIEPLQDLHGYDNPWPAGGGVNKFDESTVLFGHWIDSDGVESTQSSFGCVGSAIPVTGGTNVGVVCFGNTPFSLSVVEYATDNTFIQRDHFQNTTTTTVTLQANTAYIKLQISCGNDSSSIMDSTILATYKVVLYLGSTIPTEYMPYSNICPISGFTGVDIMGAGRNLLSYLNNRTNNGITFTYDQETGSYHVSGTASSGAWSDVGISASAVVNYPKLHAGTYIVSGFNDNVTGRVQAWYNDSTNETLITTVRESATFTLTREAYVYLRAYVGADKSVDETLYPMIRFAFDTDSTFELSHSTTYPITFPSEAGTVYGGYVDVTNGKLVVDRLFVTVDGSGVHPEIGSSGNGITRGLQSNPNGTPYYIRIGGTGDKAVYYPNIDKVNNGTCAICDTYVSTPNNNGNAGSLKTYQFRLGNNTVDSNSKLFYFIRPETSVENLLASLSNNPFHFVYYLATPIIYNITPTQIALLYGVNNIWHDANGDTDVTYNADTKMQLDSVREEVEEVRDIIAQTEPTSTASQNYAVGDYLILNNQLYKVTVAISSGETITPGTNAELITLTSEVKSQGASIAANASAIATLQTAPYDPMSLYLQFLRTYANGSVSSSGRTFAVDKNKITITATGTNSTYAYVNITGSELRTRTGTFANMSLFENDFAKADWINNVGSANRVIMTAMGNVNKDPNSINNHFVIVTRTYEGDDPSNATITRNTILQFTSSNATTAILDNYLTGCTDFAIYYCAKRSAYAAGEVIWRIDRIPILDAPTT